MAATGSVLSRQYIVGFWSGNKKRHSPLSLVNVFNALRQWKSLPSAIDFLKGLQWRDRDYRTILSRQTPTIVGTVCRGSADKKIDN
ncbi:hypothetical protein C7I86_12850 [Synechocystis sp. IPPAS B-1465]|nr:hypothetical protein C7I86_12850 [Synechocystis sp. IPPAS B-1465]